ncbi:hypothetical protein LCI18_013890 [Fusarium solani-melongenae]|uniref:Uncharacterized protein n=1 Tax=Fusarium solani subsp. cucurbitae TaxID=2747967 RepID=A0ACD3ZPF3_FUSSC|nr:hypothetical protein LCI18_013890 [Fusarium solani-melongenae]
MAKNAATEGRQDLKNSISPVPDDQEVGEVTAVDARLFVGDRILPQTRRVMTPRRAQFLMMGGLVGTAIWTGIGYQLNNSGSLGLWLGKLPASPLTRLITHDSIGMIAYGILAVVPTTWAVTEMGTYLPIQGTFYAFVNRYVDPAASFAIGWMGWYAGAIFVATEYTAIAILFNFWTDVNPGVWIVLCIALSTLSNSLGVIITIIGLLIMTFIVMLGGNPHHDRFGFTHFKDPVLIKEYVGEGSWGRFLAVWSALIYATFAIGGPDIMITMLGELQHPRRNFPRISRQIYLRLFLFYGLGVLAIGILCSSSDPNLINGINFSEGGTNISPWIVGIKNLDISVLPHILNAVFITSAWSCANMSIYSSSRIVYALALQRDAPAIFRRCTPNGSPWVCIALSSIVSCVAFLVCGNNAVVVFQWLAGLFGGASMIAFAMMNVTFLRFRAGLRAQGIPLKSLPYVGHLQPYGSYVALVVIVLGLLTNGWTAFLYGKFDTKSFFTGYLGIAWFVIFFLGYKIYFKTKFIKASEMDLHSDMDIIAEYEKANGYDKPVVLTGWRKTIDFFW